jgi:predicted ATPase
MREAAQVRRYNRTVFIAPPWPAIFTQDDERKQTPEEAERTYHAMTRVYAEYGYALLELPRASVAERVRFVLQHAGAR